MSNETAFVSSQVESHPQIALKGLSSNCAPVNVPVPVPGGAGNLSMAGPVCSMAGPRWSERNSTSGSGRRSRPFCKHNAAPEGGARTTATSSRRCFGGDVPGCLGVTCRNASDPARRYSIDSIAGPSEASGISCFLCCRRMSTTNGTAWTARPTGRTSTPPAQRGGRKPTPLVAHEAASPARCTWSSTHWDCR